MAGARVLLVLDDLWDREQEEQLNFTDPAAGARVLISCRVPALWCNDSQMRRAAPTARICEVVSAPRTVVMLARAATRRGFEASAEGKDEWLWQLLTRRVFLDMLVPNQIMNEACTALYIAATKGHAGCVKMLLEARAGVNVPTATGRTPLTMASYKGHAQVVRLLLQ